MVKTKYVRPPDVAERNRLYAKNMRQKKKEYIVSLENEISVLKHENVQLHTILGWLIKKQ
jgi:hypothetical protein